MFFHFRLLRAFDGILYGILGLILLLLLAKAGVLNPAGTTGDLLLLAPVLLAGLFTFAIPAQPAPGLKWVRHLQWLRGFALAWLLLAPFLLWYDVQPTSTYLLANLFAAAVAAVAWLYKLNDLIVELAEANEDSPLALEARINRKLLLLLFVLVCAVGVVLLMTSSSPDAPPLDSFSLRRWLAYALSYTVQPPPFDSLRMLLMSMGRWGITLLFLPTLPVLLTASLLFRVRLVVARQVRHELTPPSVPARQPAGGARLASPPAAGATEAAPQLPPPPPTTPERAL